MKGGRKNRADSIAAYSVTVDSSTTTSSLIQLQLLLCHHSGFVRRYDHTKKRRLGPLRNEVSFPRIREQEEPA